MPIPSAASERETVTLKLSREIFLPFAPVIGVEYSRHSWSETAQTVRMDILNQRNSSNVFRATAEVRSEAEDLQNAEALPEYILSRFVGYWDHICLKAKHFDDLNQWLSSPVVYLYELSNRLHSFEAPDQGLQKAFLTDLNRSREAYRIHHVFVELLACSWTLVEKELDAKSLEKLRTLEEFMASRNSRSGLITRVFGV